MRPSVWVGAASLIGFGLAVSQLEPARWLLPDLIAGRVAELDARFAEEFSPPSESVRVASLSPDVLPEIAETHRGAAEVAAWSGGAESTLAESIQTGAQDADAGADAAESEMEPPAALREFLVATKKRTWVYERPNSTSKKLGYLRSGALVRRYGQPVASADCPRGYVRIDPLGYVCSGRDASLDEHHPAARAQSTRPQRSAALPYEYALSRHPAPHEYTRVPSPEEQATTEPDLGYHLSHSKTETWQLADLPWFLAEGQPSLRVNGSPQSGLVLHHGQALAKSGFAFLETFEVGARRFGLTTEMSVVPLDRVERVEPSGFHGLSLLGTLQLPVAFVRSRAAYLYRGHPTGQGLEISEKLQYRDALPLSGESVRVGGQAFLATRDGRWLIDRDLVKVEALKQVPAWVQSATKWIDVSIRQQTLVAYRGTTPEFVTLVSTGVGGLGDPNEVPATVQGRFRVHTKHVSVSMSGDEVGDEFELRDVPYVQYFKDGYALHAAYWHDGFGAPKSHGCVNLSPLDARWLFGWTDPPVPQSWHGAMSLLDGTQLSIHP